MSTSQSGDQANSRRGLRPLVLAAMMVLAAVVLVDAAGLFERLELAGNTAELALRGPRKSKAKMLIVELDDRTVNSWPEPIIFWGGHLGDVITRCSAAGAKTIGLDIVFAGDPDAFLDKVDPQATAPRPLATLVAAISNAQAGGTPIVLANYHDPEGRAIDPSPFILAVLGDDAHVGFVDVSMEADGTVRRMALGKRTADSVVPGFAALVAQTAEPRLSFARAPETEWINPTEATATILPAADVGVMPLDKLKRIAEGAIVLVGTSYSGSQDFHLDSLDQLTPGVQIQANAISTLLDDKPIRRPGRLWQALLTGFCGVAVLLGLRGQSLRRGALGVLALLAIWFIGCQIVFSAQDLWLPLAGPLFAVFLTSMTFFTVRGFEESILNLRLQSLFGRFLSKEAAQYLIANQDRLSMGGALIDASILFFDVRDSTAMAEALGPTAAVDRLNSLYRTVIPAIEERQGFVSNFVGDGLMAVFGGLGGGRDHAKNAVEAALEMLGRIEVLNATLQPQERWRVGIGVHTGQVLQGNLGDEGRSAFTYMGDTVNVAARLEGLCKELGSRLVVSRKAFEEAAVETSLFCGPIEQGLRGRPGKFQLYYLTKDLSAA